MKLKMRRRTASVVLASSICIILVTVQFYLGVVQVAAFSPTGTTATATTTMLERTCQRTAVPPATVMRATTVTGTMAASRRRSSRSRSTLHSSSSSSSSRSTAAVPDTADTILQQALLERQQQRRKKPRTIRVERYARLPVWPVWAGVIDFFVGWIFGPEVGSRLEQYVLGGRVCPMQFDTTTSSPFILLVHHHHNFWKWDFLFRKLSALVLPEGFPAHPHRGFTTLTYFLPNDDNADSASTSNTSTSGGGFIHRDSLGIKQTYGSKGGRYTDEAQWLFTGSGMLHEEMFDFSTDQNEDEQQHRYDSRYELYQLWVNVPAQYKLQPPQVQLLRTIDTTDTNDVTVNNNDNGNTAMATTHGVMPTVSSSSFSSSSITKSRVVVIAGKYTERNNNNAAQKAVDSTKIFTSQTQPVHSDLSILHVTITETATTGHNTGFVSKNAGTGSIELDQAQQQPRGWTYHIPNNHDTLIVYVRKGSCTMFTQSGNSDTTSSGYTSNSDEATMVPIHSTVFIDQPRSSETTAPPSFLDRLVVIPTKVDDPVDLLILSGAPLYATATTTTANDTTGLEWENKPRTLEPIATQGSMVMNYPSEIEQAYADYQYGEMGIPWDHEFDDDEWMDHIRKTSQRMNTRIQ